MGIAVVMMGDGFIHPLVGVLPHCQDEGARRDAAVRYYTGKHWRVRVIRPDDGNKRELRSWMSDRDVGVEVWEGMRDEAERYAAERRRVYPKLTYQVAIATEVL